MIPPFNCAPTVNYWNQVSVGAAGDAWALGTEGGTAGVAAPNYITCVPQPGNPTGCDSSCGGLVPVPTSPSGFHRVNEDLSWCAAGVWVVVQSDPATPRWDGALHAYDPFMGAWFASRYDMGGRRLFPARWVNCHDGVYVFREKSPGATPITPNPRADLYLVDRFLTVLARFTYPAGTPGDALGPVNIDLAGDVWVSLDPLDTPWTEVVYDKFTPTTLVPAPPPPGTPCGITPPTDPQLRRLYRSPFARGPGSWYYRSFMESGPCTGAAPAPPRGAIASPVPPRSGGR